MKIDISIPISALDCLLHLISIWSDDYPNIVHSGCNNILYGIKENGLISHRYELLLLRVSQRAKSCAKATRKHQTLHFATISLLNHGKQTFFYI